MFVCIHHARRNLCRLGTRPGAPVWYCSVVEHICTPESTAARPICTGALGEVTARDGFLSSLCEFAVATSEPQQGTPPPESQVAASLQAAGAAITAALNQAAARASAAAAAQDAAASSTAASGGGGPGSAAPAAPAAAPPAAAVAVGPPVLGVKNIHALRTLFNVSHRLADSLGPAWVYVVEVLYTLDRALPQAAGSSAGKVSRLPLRTGTRLQAAHHLGRKEPLLGGVPFAQACWAAYPQRPCPARTLVADLHRARTRTGGGRRAWVALGRAAHPLHSRAPAV